MKDLNFIDRDGQPLPGKVPVQVRVYGQGNEPAARAACQQAFDAFLSEVRLGGLKQLQRAVAVPGLCTARFSHQYGVTTVDLHLVPTSTETGEAAVGFLARLRVRSTVPATLTTSYGRETVAGGAAASGGVLTTDAYGVVEPFDQGYIDSNFPYASIGEYASRVLRAGTVSNLVLITPLANGVRIRAIPESAVPVAGDLIAVNTLQDTPLLSATTAILNTPKRMTVSQFVYGGAVLAIPTLTHVLDATHNAPTRMYVHLARGMPARGIAIVAIQAALYSFTIGVDATWQLLGTATVPTTGPQNFFGANVSVSRSGAAETVTLTGSNAAGVCSSISVTVEFDRAPIRVTGAVSPMAIPVTMPPTSLPSGTWAISEAPGSTVAETPTSTLSISPSTAAAISGYYSSIGAGDFPVGLTTGTTADVRGRTYSESSTATTYILGTAKVTHPLTGTLHAFVPTAETTASRSTSVSAAASSETGTGSFSRTYNYFDPFPTVLVGTATHDYFDARIRLTYTETFVTSMTRLLDGVTQFSLAENRTVSGPVGNGLTGAPTPAYERSVTAIGQGDTWTIASNPNTVITTSLTATGRSEFDHEWSSRLISAADELAQTAFTIWDFDETIHVEPPPGEIAWQGAVSRTDTLTYAWAGYAYNAPTSGTSGSGRQILINSMRFDWITTPTAWSLQTETWVKGTRVRFDIEPVTRAVGTAPQVVGFATQFYNGTGTHFETSYTQGADLVRRVLWGLALQTNAPSPSAPSYSYTYTQAPFPDTPYIQVTAPPVSGQIGSLTGTLDTNDAGENLWEYRLSEHAREAATDLFDEIDEVMPSAGPILDVVLYDPRTQVHLIQKLSAVQGSTVPKHQLFLRNNEGLEIDLRPILRKWLKETTIDPATSPSARLVALGDDLPAVYIQALHRGASLL